jgi:two-component sensor histidine kinase
MTETCCQPPNGLLLLRELNHRVNNELAAIINNISLAAARSPHDEVKLALNTATEVLHRYAAVHRLLKMPGPDTQVDAAEYVRELCTALSRSKLQPMGLGMVLELATITLASERCWRLGLIVYELVSNAARHAFRGRPGAICVSLQCADDLVCCKVSDDGSASGKIGSGQGCQIVSDLARELGGRLQQQFRPNGSTSTLLFPLVTRPAGARRAPGKRSQRQPITVASGGPLPYPPDDGRPAFSGCDC